MKCIFLLALLACTYQALSQDRILLNNKTTISAPNGSIPYKDTEKKAWLVKTLGPAADSSVKYSYINGTVIIRYLNTKNKPSSDFLDKQKHSMDVIYHPGDMPMYKDEPKRKIEYTSEIKDFAGKKALIISNYVNNKGFYKFYCINSDYTLLVVGEMEYQRTENDKAATILNDALKNITFSKQ